MSEVKEPKEMTPKEAAHWLIDHPGERLIRRCLAPYSETSMWFEGGILYRGSLLDPINCQSFLWPEQDTCVYYVASEYCEALKNANFVRKGRDS